MGRALGLVLVLRLILILRSWVLCTQGERDKKKDGQKRIQDVSERLAPMHEPECLHYP